MKFLFLIHGDEEGRGGDDAGRTPRDRGEHMAYADMLRGAYVLGEAREGPASAAVVSPGEEPFVTDGPFAETKEAVGGFYVVECEGREEALELAGKVPSSPEAAVEVLTIAEL